MNFNCVLRISSNVRAPLNNYQSVRWRRLGKPFWLGIAKSKMFVLPTPRKNRTREERAEIVKLTKIYNTQMKSLRKFIDTDNPFLKIQKENVVGLEKEDKLQELIEESYRRNEEWNAYSAELREKRLAEIQEKKIEKALLKIKSVEEEKNEKLEKINKIVRLEKEKSKSFITMENLDEAIENCLESFVEYNYAVDLQGNKYSGKDPFDNQTSNFEKIDVSDEVSDKSQQSL